MVTIKRIILLAFVTLMMVGCDGPIAPKKVIKHVDEFDVVVVDSCEYIYKEEYQGYQGYGLLAHKGNCRFCKERRQKELKELVEQLKKK